MVLIIIFHSCSLVFNCIAAVQCSCSICGHSSSLVFSCIPFVFSRVPFVFTRVPFVFTRVDQCSLVFRLVWSFRSDLHESHILIAQIELTRRVDDICVYTVDTKRHRNTTGMAHLRIFSNSPVFINLA